MFSSPWPPSPGLGSPSALSMSSPLSVSAWPPPVPGHLLRRDHLQKKKTVTNASAGVVAIPEAEARSFVRDAAAVLLIVYGGEAITAPALGIPPSFMLSGVVPALYTGIQAIVDNIPSIPFPSLESEVPLAALDGIARAYLLCNLIPPMVLDHSSPAINSNPWTLILTSLLTANGGFFLTNMFSFFQPYPLTLTTPAEMLPYGWTTTDLCPSGRTRIQSPWAGWARSGQHDGRRSRRGGPGDCSCSVRPAAGDPVHDSSCEELWASAGEAEDEGTMRRRGTIYDELRPNNLDTWK
ncbi:hypothetical protein A0H81_04901 [Grifola frondosa]|uniref:Uncharacterized protein n=1 Tax=Grifola frondosa TaxID=5627 RepID=A0A1C7MEU9_GRIFR|nr:hypothetical protein A0H81_04901 [Grifola frondosa]